MTAKQNFIFSTDSYHQDSIKSQERVIRGCGEQFILQRSATRKPKDFKAFLTNYENKRQLWEVLLQVWSSWKGALMWYSFLMELLIDFYVPTNR